MLNESKLNIISPFGFKKKHIGGDLVWQWDNDYYLLWDNNDKIEYDEN